MQTPQVLLVHGINSRGDWYPVAREALEPHFAIVPFRYSEYEEEGYAKVVTGRGLGVGMTLAAFATNFRDELRRGVVVRLRAEIERLSRAGDLPHVVAHSFGTYLLGEALEHFPSLAVDRVVLTGAVMRPDYPWTHLVSTDPHRLGRVGAVRNETSSDDPAPRAAHRARHLLGGLGGAGWHGFATNAVVHTALDEMGRCAHCPPQARVPVHNVPLGDFPHSDHFLGPGHGERFWMPFLWGIAPEDYFLYARACTFAYDGVRAAVERDWALERQAIVSGPTAARTWSILRDLAWPWLQGRSLHDVFVELAADIGKPAARVVRDGLYWVSRAHDDAKQACHRRVTSSATDADVALPDETAAVVRRLHPLLALDYALSRLLEP